MFPSRRDGIIVRLISLAMFVVAAICLVKWSADSVYFEPTTEALQRAHDADIWGIAGVLLLIATIVLLVIARKPRTKQH